MKIAFGLLVIVLGVVTGEWLTRFPLTHDLAGRLAGRGGLVALVGRAGIFEADVRAERARIENCTGERQTNNVDAIVEELVACEVLSASASRSDHQAEVHRLLASLRDQFADERKFRAALTSSRFSNHSLRQILARTVAGEHWIEIAIAPRLTVTREEIAAYFQEHPAKFVLPARLFVRHIFLAAPEGSPPELVESKGRAMQEVVARLGHGEDFAQLAAAISEDEASKGRGGDLGFIAVDRTPAEFFAAIENLPPDAPAMFVQSHLGFHAVQVMESRRAREMTVEEAVPEISAELSAWKRRNAVEMLRKELAKQRRLIVQKPRV